MAKKGKGHTAPQPERGQGTKVQTGSSSTVRIKGAPVGNTRTNRGRK